MIHSLGTAAQPLIERKTAAPAMRHVTVNTAHARRSAIVGDSLVALAPPPQPAPATTTVRKPSLGAATGELATLRLEAGQLMGSLFPDLQDQARGAGQDIRNPALQSAYLARLEAFWARNAEPMQAAAEADILQFALSHRRADERARALGITESAAARLQLSDQALGMLAEAAGNRDPDLRDYGTRTYAFDINGYAADDMAWLRASDGNVVLLMPGNERHIRQYPSLEAMRDDIQKMLCDDAGRQEMARHFSSYNRSDGVFYQGVDQWLVDLAKGGYNDRIACASMAYKGDFRTLLGQPDARGQALLSDRALAMLCEAAGHPDPTLGTQGTQAFVFDINTYQSSDMSWLRAADGHVVLIMPGSARPVCEYPDLDAMRAAIVEMTRSGDGLRELAHHFSVYNRRDGVTYQGVDQWLADIREGMYNRRIAYLPQHVSGNVFRHQIAAGCEAEREKLRYLYRAQASSAAQEQCWLADFSSANQAFTRVREPEPGCVGERSRQRRAIGDDLIQACQRGRQRAGQWARSIRHRLLASIDRLRQDAREQATPAAPARRVASAATQTDWREPNERGFLESSNFGTLYRYMYVTPRSNPHGAYRRDPEVHGFPSQYRFAAGRQALDGEVMDAFLTPEAAQRAIEVSSRDRRYYWLYEIDVRGLRCVSFGDNRLHNPDYDALMQDNGWETLVRVADSIFVAPYSTSGYRTIEDQIVQIRMDGDMAHRTTRIDGRFIN
ncbi:dermonecrotic toxin domain-containing protein [Herbaspirillum sp. YR522]|uniref:dermonecrotic toxin domain-containing protein n=1 Tax=Herbaspirillum sp. YR522 TaxID=1144342 RepID=UPI00026F6598|nr:DUF6543 domain-containing protein [Herbaspirillum sp. YR522]EJM97309.1 hypothetical protein PMI40_04461 [Herbaspirillum sp. YR522]